MNQLLGMLSTQSLSGISGIEMGSSINITSNTTLTEPVLALPGTVFNISSGVTLTISTALLAGRYKIFEGAGTVSFSGNNGAISEAYPEWWGAVADSTTDNSTELAAAIKACENGKVTLSLSNGGYNFSTALKILDRMTLKGQNKEDSKLIWTGGAAVALTVDASFVGGDDPEETYLGHFSIENAGTGTVGLQIDTSYTTVDHVRVAKEFSTANIRTNTAVNTNQLQLLNCEVRSQNNPGGTIGLLIPRGANISIYGGYYGNFDTCIELGQSGQLVTNMTITGGPIIETFDPQNSTTATGLKIKSVGALNIVGARFQSDNSNHRAIRVEGAYRGGLISGCSFDGTGIATAAITFGSTSENAEAVVFEGNYFQSVGSGSTNPIEVTGGHLPDVSFEYNKHRSTANRPIADPTLPTNDATPNVGLGNYFVTNNTSATTITDLDGVNVAHTKVVTVVFGDSNTTVSFSRPSLKGKGGSNWSPSLGDSMTCTHHNGLWYCLIS